MKSESVYNAFLETTAKQGRKAALICLGEEYSYAMLKMESERLASSLHALGIRPGDKVIIYIPNCPQWVVMWLALQYLGAVAVPVSPIYTVHDLAYIAGDSGAKAILCADTNFGYVKLVKESGTTQLKTIIYTNVADMLPQWKRWIGFGFDRIPFGKVEEGSNIHRFTRLLRAKPDPSLKAEPPANEILEILYTGGTAAFPKGVPIPHDVLIESFITQLQVSEPLIPLEENVIAQGAPLFHVLGQLFGLGPICLTGATVVIMPRVNLDAILLYIQRYHIKTLFGVPTLYRMILEHDRVDFYDLSSLRYCFTGGDVLPMEVLKRWRNKFGTRIYQGYGATETCGGVTMVPVTGDPPDDTIGTIMSTKATIVVNTESLEEVPPGQPGELLASSSPMISLYWNKNEETQECYIERDGRLWYKTGDIVRMDDKGYMYFVDRTADIIKHKGYRISASEIEAILKDHIAVIAACVVGIPDTRVGERIKAFVVLKEDAEGVTGFELTRWCKERLTSYKIPEYIEFRDMLPKSKVGKYLRRELRDQERKRDDVY
jgi:long-chain acyl-CoA synthetase